MISRKRLAILIVLVIIVLGCGLAVFSGVLPVRLADTHNVTVALGEYNSWAGMQKTLDRQVRFTLEETGSHTGTFNLEMAQEQPDMNLIRQNVAMERQLLTQWEDEITTLDLATTKFSRATSGLDYPASPDTGEVVLLMAQNMRIYTIHMKNAQQHLTDYVNQFDAYIRDNDPDYWDDEYRQAALDAKQKAADEITSGDEALAAIMSGAAKLQQAQ